MSRFTQNFCGEFIIEDKHYFLTLFIMLLIFMLTFFRFLFCRKLSNFLLLNYRINICGMQKPSTDRDYVSLSYLQKLKNVTEYLFRQHVINGVFSLFHI